MNQSPVIQSLSHMPNTIRSSTYTQLIIHPLNQQPHVQLTCPYNHTTIHHALTHPSTKHSICHSTNTCQPFINIQSLNQHTLHITILQPHSINTHQPFTSHAHIIQPINECIMHSLHQPINQPFTHQSINQPLHHWCTTNDHVIMSAVHTQFNAPTVHQPINYTQIISIIHQTITHSLIHSPSTPRCLCLVSSQHTHTSINHSSLITHPLIHHTTNQHSINYYVINHTPSTITMSLIILSCILTHTTIQPSLITMFPPHICIN